VGLTGRGDLDDQRWLDQQVATLGDGIGAARDIWANWTDLRNVGRFHPGQSAGDFIASQLGGVRLDLPRLIAALPDMSNPQLAAVAGVDTTTVLRAKQRYADAHPDAEPARVIGADGKSYPGRVVGTTTAEVIEPEEAALTPAEAKGPSFLRTFRHALRNFRAEYGEFASHKKYAALFAAIDKALED
jgi:hypothetical protein